jgi:mono/diheme cytochrome c family protein
MFPPLKGNATVQQKEPTSVIRVILEGARTVPTKQEPTTSEMPAFDWKLSDEQVAQVASFVRNSWDNHASAVSAADVKALRKALHEAAIPKTK